MEKKTLNKKRSLTDIMLATLKCSNLTYDDLHGSSRKERICDARAAFCVVAKEYKYSYREIGSEVSRSETWSQNMVKDRNTQDKGLIAAIQNELKRKDLQYLGLQLASNPESSYIRDKIIQKLTNEQ